MLALIYSSDYNTFIHIFTIMFGRVSFEYNKARITHNNEVRSEKEFSKH